MLDVTYYLLEVLCDAIDCLKKTVLIYALKTC